MTKQKDKWLKKLNSKIIMLNDGDRKDIINNYSEQIDIEISEGKEITTILNQLEPIETIAKNVYVEFGINYKLDDKKIITNSLNKIAYSMFNMFIILIVGIVTILFVATALMIAVVIIPAIVIVFISYDVGPAFGFNLLIITAGPVLTIAFGWISYYGYIYLVTLINKIYKSYTEIDLIKIKKINFKAIPKKVILIICVATVALLSSGMASTFAGNKTLGGAAINNNYLNSTTDIFEFESDHKLTEADFDTSDLKSDTKIVFNNTSLTLREETKVEITHNFQWKKSQVKPINAIDKDGKIKISFDRAWYLDIISIGSDEIIITIK